jgi:hypothetical protein
MKLVGARAIVTSGLSVLHALRFFGGPHGRHFACVGVCLCIRMCVGLCMCMCICVIRCECVCAHSLPLAVRSIQRHILIILSTSVEQKKQPSTEVQLTELVLW